MLIMVKQHPLTGYYIMLVWFRDNQEVADLILDSNDFEREKGITIYKNISVRYKDVKFKPS